jgi:hypothetical protein
MPQLNLISAPHRSISSSAILVQFLEGGDWQLTSALITTRGCLCNTHFRQSLRFEALISLAHDGGASERNPSLLYSKIPDLLPVIDDHLHFVFRNTFNTTSHHGGVAKHFCPTFRGFAGTSGSGNVVAADVAFGETNCSIGVPRTADAMFHHYKGMGRSPPAKARS